VLGHGGGVSGAVISIGGETGLRRARAALTALLALAVVVLPGAASWASPASSGQQGGSPVSLAITGMTPRWATPTARITVSGTVTNDSKQQITDLAVQLYTSNQPVGSLAQLQSAISGQTPLADSALSGGPQLLASPLRPGGSASWSISFAAQAAGLTAFGVYPLTIQLGAEVGGSLDTTLSSASTFLPYVPASRGSYAKTRPAAEQIAWVWPLIGTPLTGLPGLPDCTGSQVSQLDASLAPGGRLNGLLAAGSSYGRADSITWAVDPALLTDANALSACSGGTSKAAKASAAWLTRLRAATSGQPLFVTPYADVSLALIWQGHSGDVERAFRLGRQVAQAILQRDVSPSGTGPQTAGIAWPPDGTAGYSTAENLATNGVQTVLLDDSKVGGRSGSAFVVADGEAGGYMRVLLYSDALARVLSGVTSAAGSSFAAGQAFLAETAVMAAQDPGQPIVVAPPQRWRPPSSLADAVLSATATAPWLKPVTVTSLVNHLTGKDPLQLPDGADAGSFSHSVIQELNLVDQEVAELEGVSASDNPDPYEAVATLESSAWRHGSRAEQLARLDRLAAALSKQERDVLIVTGGRVTLGGLKGTIPVVVDNKLDYPVTVRLQLSWRQPPGGGIRVQQPPGAITLAAKSQQTVHIHVQATQVGATTITMRLLSPHYAPLPSPAASVTVQATQFGTLAMIILAGALGVFVIASAVRAIRRGRPAPPGDAGTGGNSDDKPGGHDEPRRDTVVRERTELGTAGTSGL